MKTKKEMKRMRINRTNDVVFKTIFGSEKHKDITLSLINAVFEFNGTQQIEDIEFIDRELNPAQYTGKGSRLDILGRSADGTKVNVEIQVADEGNMCQRVLYYWSRLYNDLKAGEDYSELSRTVSINILEYKLFPFAEFHSRFGAYDIEKKYQLTQDMEIHFLEIPKWKLRRVKEMNRLEKWLGYFSKKTEEIVLEEIAMSEPAIQEAMKAERLFTEDEVARYQYEQAEKARRDHINSMNYATKIGFERGIKQGIEQGIERGKIETALGLFSLGLGLDVIEKATGLSQEKLARLQQEKAKS